VTPTFSLRKTYFKMEAVNAVGAGDTAVSPGKILDMGKFD